MLDAAKQDIFSEVEELIATLRKFELDISKALYYSSNSHTYQQLCTLCLRGAYDVYPLPNAVIICETVKYPQYTAYNVFIACGKLDEIIEAQNDLLIREAKLRGASKLTMTGRKGWVKTLEKQGWRHTLAVMEKELPDG